MSYERLFDPAVVARSLGYTAETIRSWIRAGKVVVIRVPSGHYRIPASEFDRLRKAQKTQTDAQKSVDSQR